MTDSQSPEGLPEESPLHVDALPGMQPVDLAHGIGCVVVMLPKTGPRDPAVTVLWVKQARQLAVRLLRQARAAEDLLREHAPVSSADDQKIINEEEPDGRHD